MGKSGETTTKFKVDISELKAGIQEANRQIALANSEFKKASAGMESWGKDADGLSAKLQQLRTVTAQYEQILSDLQGEYNRVVQEQGENSKGAQELKIKMNGLEAAIKSNNSAIDRYDTQLQEMGSGSQEAATASEKLEKTIQEQEGELSDLKKQYKDVVLEQGKGSAAAKELDGKIDQLSGELNENRETLKQAEHGTEDLSDSMNEAEKGTQKLSGGFSVVKGALASLVADGIKKAADGLKNMAKAAIDSYVELDEGADNVIKATGTLGKAGEELQKSYKNVAKTVRGEFSALGDTVGEVNTRFGFTGEELEKCSVKFVKFADLAGTDAKGAVQLVSRAMGDAGIPAQEYEQVLDELTVAAQASGVSMDKLTENLTKYGAPMRALGFDTKESIAIFSSWEKAGVNTEIAFSGMKKAISNWAAAGKDSREEFKKTLEEIAKCPDISTATTKAIEVFGQKAGPDLADAIQEGRFEYSDMLSLIEGSQGSLESTYGATQDGIDKVKLKIQEAKVEIGDFVGGLINEYQPQIEEFVQKFVDGVKNLVLYIKDHMPEIKQAIQNAIEKAREVIQSIITKFKDFANAIAENKDTVIAGLKGIAVAFAAIKIGGAITGILKFVGGIKAAGGVLAALKVAFAAIGGPVTIVIALIAGVAAAFATLWNKSEAFRNFWLGLWEKIKSAVSTAIDAIINFFTVTIPDAWNGFLQFCGTFIENVVTFFQELPGKIGTFLTKTISDIGNWAADMVGKAKELGINFLTAVITFFSELPSKIAYYTGYAIGTVIKWAANMATKAKETGTKFLNNVINFIKQLPGKIASFLSNVINNVIQWAANMASKAKEAGENFAKNVVNFIKNLPGKVWALLTNVIGKAANFVSEMAAKGMQAAKNLFDNVVNGLASLPGKMLEIGGNIVNGVWQGIQNAASTFTNNVKNFFSNIVKGAKDALGIHSPSRVFRDQVGKNIVEGVKTGIAKNASGAINEVIKLSNKMLNAAMKANGNYKAAGSDAVKNFESGYKKMLETSSANIENLIKEKINKRNETLDKKRDEAIAKQEAATEEANKALKKQINKSNKERINEQIAANNKALKKRKEAIKKNTDEEKKAYEKSAKSIMESYEKSMSTAADKVKNKLKSKLTEIAEAAQEKFDEVQKLQDDLNKKLSEHGELFTRDENNGIIVSNINNDINTLKKYGSNLEKLKGEISNDLMNEISGMSVQDAVDFTEALLEMSGDELKAYNNAYTKKIETAKSVSQAFFADQIKTIKSEFTDKVNEAFEGVKSQLQEAGENAIEGFVQGMAKKGKNKAKEVKKLANSIAKQFRKALKINSPSKVFEKIGEFSGEGYINGLSETLGNIKSAITQIDKKAIAGLGMNGPQTGSGTVTYNFYQTNNSPKALSRLDIYRQTKNQIALAKGV